MSHAMHHSTSTNTNAKIIRKQRKVNNSYFNTDDVNQLPGAGYSEWINISKSKLIARENVLIRIRIDSMNSIVNKELESFNNDKNKTIKYAIPEKIFDDCLLEISDTINKWQGIDLNKRISCIPYKSFREYFNVAKNWWDQKKPVILGSVLWTPVFICIQKFTLNNLNNKSQLYQILFGLFDSKIRYANTREQPLIPNGVIKNCKAMKAFLFGLNNLLNIDLWLKQQIINEKNMDQKNNIIRKRTGNSKIIVKQLKQNLIKLVKESTKINNINHNTLNTLNTNTSNINTNINHNYNNIIFHLADNFIATNNINNSIQSATKPQNAGQLINRNSCQIPQIVQIPQISYITSYNGYHITSNQLQISNRYHPFNRNNCNAFK